MNPISILNEYCQKNSLALPEFTFSGVAENWSCLTKFSYSLTKEENEWKSKSYTTKQAAKEDVARQIIEKLPEIKQNNFRVLPENTVFLIDGDQRMDCWKWIAKCTLSNTTFVTVFISPTCPIPNSIVENDKISVKKSKTTNKDSSDALMLITLGQIISSSYKIIIVSSDHILVQAAQDLEISYAPHLQGLIKLIDTFE